MADRDAADGKKKWTVLIYFSTDNNLSEEGIFALKELKKVGGTKVNVFAQFDPVGRGNTTRRFHIRRADDLGRLKPEDVFEELGETDMNDPETLRRFLVAGIQEFNADTDHYILILSGHGGGQDEGIFLRDEERRLSSIPSSFPLTDLKERVFDDDEVVRELGPNKKIDILGFDACMMSMVEVCYELHDCAILNLVIGSEGFTLNSGWPYDRMVRRLQKEPYLDPVGLAKFIVKDHSDFYADYHLGGLSTDLAVIRLAQIPALTARIEELAVALKYKFEQEKDRETDDTEELPEGMELFYKLNGRDFQDAMILSHWASQSYNGEQSVDLFDFCELLQRRAPRFETIDNPDSIFYHCERVKQEIVRAIALSCDVGSAFQFSRGVSICFPWSRVNISPHYPRIRFSREARRWLEFINVYADATQRLPRRREPAELRSTPPYNKGPEGRILSMRNPPSRFKLYVCDPTEEESTRPPAAEARPSAERADGQKAARKRKK